MMKVLATGLAVMMLAGSLVGCGASASDSSSASVGSEAVKAETALKGTVSLAGSTSMEKLCEAISESFMEAYPDITVTVEYTGSGAGIEALTAGTLAVAAYSKRKHSKYCYFLAESSQLKDSAEAESK